MTMGSKPCSSRDLQFLGEIKLNVLLLLTVSVILITGKNAFQVTKHFYNLKCLGNRNKKEIQKTCLEDKLKEMLLTVIC